LARAAEPTLGENDADATFAENAEVPGLPTTDMAKWEHEYLLIRKETDLEGRAEHAAPQILLKQIVCQRAGRRGNKLLHSFHCLLPTAAGDWPTKRRMT
jgi:hypothetical protein